MIRTRSLFSDWVLASGTPGVSFLGFSCQLGEAVGSVPQPSCGKREWEGKRVGLTTSPGLWDGRKYRKADGVHDSRSLPAVLLGGPEWEPGPALGQEKGWVAKGWHKGSWYEVSEVHWMKLGNPREGQQYSRGQLGLETL